MKMAPWILHCYPRRWRERYQEEMLALLEQHTITPITVLDLLLGALDARLNSIYRSKEGPMFQHIRDNRSLSIIYLCALAVFLLSNSFWFLLIFQGPVDGLAGGVATAIMNNVGVIYDQFLIPLTIFVALLGTVSITIGKACKKRQWGAVIFALLCLGITLWILWVFPSLFFFPNFPKVHNLSELYLIPNLFSLLPSILAFILPICLFGGGLFLIGVKGLKLLHDRQRWPLFFVLLIGLLAPASYLMYISWGHNNVMGGSLIELILIVCFMSGIYLALSGLLLTLTNGNLTRRGWQIARMCGSLLTILLLLRLIVIIVLDVNRWIEGGGVWAFDPLLINTLILAIALAFMLLALIHSFLISAATRVPTTANA